MDGFAARGIDLAVANAAARGHRLHFAGTDLAFGAGAVGMPQRALDHPGDDLHIVVAVFTKAAARLDDIIIDDAERPIAHVVGIVVAAERKRVKAVEPANLGGAAPAAGANLK